MTTFEELSRRRHTYVEAARDNGFEEGLRKLLADLYPDNAHFIYELLQNAEDAGAREVAFELRADGLRVQHDGERLFDLQDIESITSIGQSTKANDATSIGKFGVGFKAVFAYTKTPVIYSGEHAFAIHDLFVPVPVANNERHGQTTFWFPFDQADKPSAQAATEVATALRDISRTTLLFLNNIQMIACSLPDGEERLLERRALDEHVVEIQSVHEEAASYWYRVTGEVPFDGKSFRAAAAFALQAHATKTKSEHEPTSYSVKPVDGQVFIYFPAVKETSALKFHIHAPFASTVARDSVRDDPGNDALVEGIAHLVAEALPGMRDAGLITDGLLSALPNPSDDLPLRYAVLRDRVTDAFNSEPLTPRAGGEHAPALQLLRSDRIIRNTLSVEDAARLRRIIDDRGDACVSGWLPDRDGRPRAFLESLDAVDFGRSELGEVLDRVAELHEVVASWGDEADERVDMVDRVDLASWHEWINAKSTEWLRAFYIALGSLASQHAQRYRYQYDPFLDSLSGPPMIRVRSGATFSHVPGPQAHLPTAPGLRSDGLILDDLAVFDSDSRADKAATRALTEFYDHAGVERWDAAAQLNARFSAYVNEPAVVTSRHVADLSTLRKLIDEGLVSPKSYANRPILVGVGRDGTSHWTPANRVFLDDPFQSTGLGALYRSDDYDGTPMALLSPEYAREDIDAAAIAEKLGATTGLSIKQALVFGNPQFEHSWRWNNRENENMIARDWLIPSFEVITATEDELLLRGLWQAVVSAEDACAEAVYRANASSRVHRMESQLLQTLRTVPWILDQDGNLRLPEDTTAEDLSPDLTLPTRAPLLELAGFGRKAALEARRRKGDEERAQELGFESAEVLHEIAQAYKENPQEFHEWLRERKMHSLPDAASAAPEQRARRAGEVSADAPVRKYDRRVRSIYVQVPGHRSAAKGYLTQLYTNDHGIMVCQVCASAMPFKVSGDYYFEAVQFVKDSTRDLRENRLALCPTCAAKYRHARGTSLEDLRDDLLTQEVGRQGSIHVDVELAGEPTQIRFVGKHAIDLQAALAMTGASMIEDNELDGPVLGDDAAS